MDMPIQTQNGNYTLVMNDRGTTILHSSGSGHTYTIPANASVAFPVGTVISITNSDTSNSMTLAITSDTLRLAGSSLTGSRTLGPVSDVYLKKIASTTWIVNGVGITG
jgi:hypothetical protein